ncbi:penicillin-binding transpeptidase domain-containing protein [Paenibacillus sp. LHD-117]|uniref:peptidoglycan D,D-transpeptidase FtsI family protein n=1 Tax=Paenibacillus sp. LHD-117 TaxID=3071412 RepID=UPI0027E105FC|nr:penicillin-binding transpeptidase domain-containing protein [Paenibacillus sp. LHD-117]MDQ6418562.1 penicillin-binding transpeptidase domain-containing protein [Paenibacillus sp. LHD-117]
MLKRIVIAGICMSIVLLFFIGRLAWLQLLPGQPGTAAHGTMPRESWKRMAVVQRQRSLVLDSGRGDFVDRYGKPITGETYETPALFPVHPDARGSETDLAKLAGILGVGLPELLARWDQMTAPDFWRATTDSSPYRLSREQAERIRALKTNGVRVLPYRNRYLDSFDAKHIIGFTSQHPEWLMRAHPRDLREGKRRLTEQVGGSGLEKSLDSLLHGVGETSVSYFIDGRNAPLHGLDLRIVQPKNGYYPLKAVTTIDLSLQNDLEDYADQAGLKEGAIVVLDAQNADIVAMVSRPKLPARFQLADGSEWVNHALKAVEPGSIYKLVTAAAALENKVVRKGERFHCDGEYGKYGLSCWKHGGHGDITLEEGLAQSCNIVFATLAERLRSEQLDRTAAALGVKDRIGWHNEKATGLLSRSFRLLEEEEKGRLFAADSEAVDGGVMAQSGIGQRDVRMTPLQAANLIVTLLHGGHVWEPRLVSEIDYASGGSMVEFPSRIDQDLGGSRIHPSTARALLRGMEEVVTHGTASSIRQGKWALAGKTGTAETVKDGVQRNHQWFAGYGPVKSPRYAIAVLAANRPVGSHHLATRVFRGAMDIAARQP